MTQAQILLDKSVEFKEGMKYMSVYIPLIDLTIDYMYMFFEDSYQKHRHGNA